MIRLLIAGFNWGFQNIDLFCYIDCILCPTSGHVSAQRDSNSYISLTRYLVNTTNGFVLSKNMRHREVFFCKHLLYSDGAEIDSWQNAIILRRYQYTLFFIRNLRQPLLLEFS